MAKRKMLFVMTPLQIVKTDYLALTGEILARVSPRFFVRSGRGRKAPAIFFRTTGGR